jgi:small subunit ribosomal protein S16
MLTLRFQRVGKTHDTTFRVVAVDSRFSSKSGKVKEVLGWWDPRQDKFELKTERINYWLKQGAQVSDSCYNLLVKAKIIEGKKRPVVIHQKKVKEGEEKTPIKAETPKTEEVQPSLPAQAGEVPAEPTSETPEVKPSFASTFAKASADKKATEGREEIKEEPKEEPKSEKTEKPEEKSEIPAIKEDADSK